MVDAKIPENIHARVATIIRVAKTTLINIY